MLYTKWYKKCRSKQELTEMAMEKVTIKMIAEQASVSIGTVDRALNGRGRINEATKQKILQLADSMGYQPNKLASALRRKQSFKIAVVMSRTPDYFVDELKVGVEDARRSLADYYTEIDYYFSDTLDPAEQEIILSGIDVSKYDGMAINAGGEILNPYINSFVDHGVPVVTFNTDVENSKRICYIGEDSYHTGRLAGEMMGKILGGHGTVAIFMGFNLISSHRARAAGFRDFLNERYPAIRVMDVTEYHDIDSVARSSMQQLLDNGVCVNGIFCVSTPGAVGVGECLEQHSIRNQICVIGYDANVKSARLLKAGYCSAIMYQEPRKQSYYAIMLLNSYLSKTWQPECSKYVTRTKILLAENIDDYYGTGVKKSTLI